MGEPQRAQPLLTIAIPTYNRAADLEVLLSVLLPQLEGHPEIELFISDNASPDRTEALIHAMIAAGAPIRYERQTKNLGPDANFVACFERARGSYFWLCGDDDIICPGTIDKVLRHLDPEHSVDLIHLTSYAFRDDWAAERKEDALERRFHTFTSAVQFAKAVNIMFTFISGMIVHRDRLLRFPHEDPTALLNTNLVQLSWSLPLLLHHRKSVIIWDRALAGQVGNAGGYALGKVFGSGLRGAVERLLPGRRDLARAILNFTLRRWLPAAIYDTRHSRNQRLGLETMRGDFREAYGRNFRYWLFAYPVLRLPLGLARLWLRVGGLVSMGIYMASIRGFWRKQS